MAGRIRILEDALADQIAAGEVVERPASVVKELLENAIDAGARTITVEIAHGGTDHIRVHDDGEGMSPEDAALAVRRHATSKIRSREDLEAIATLGFRGEALPSIASVSRFTLTTRSRELEAGTEVCIEGGVSPVIREVGCAPGTAVEVRDLFFNVPARKKFLKSVGTESGHVATVVKQVALAHPKLRLSLLRDGRRAQEYLPARDLRERARAVLPEEKLSHIEGVRAGVRVTATLGAPEQARSGARSLFLFVNGRPVQDRALARSVAFAYGSVLPPGRYPTGVVHIEIDPREVDVNVHPQKAEVRFSGGRAVYDAVTKVLATGLGTSAWSGPPRRSPEQRESFWGDRLGLASASVSGASANSSALPWSRPETSQKTDIGSVAEDPWGLTEPDPVPASDLAPLLGLHEAPPAQPYRPAGDLSEPRLLEPKGFFSSLRVLGQVRRMMIVCEGEGGLLVLDQHAADERVRFDKLRRAYAEREVASQQLLLPERIEASEEEVAVVEERGEELAALGFSCAPLGPRTIALRAVPALVRRASGERLLRDALAELSRSGDRAFGDAVDMVLATMACHGSIRAGDALSVEECAALLAALDEVTDFSGHCPHGRPVIYEVPFREIERRLGR